MNMSMSMKTMTVLATMMGAFTPVYAAGQGHGYDSIHFHPPLVQLSVHDVIFQLSGGDIGDSGGAASAATPSKEQEHGHGDHLTPTPTPTPTHVQSSSSPQQQYQYQYHRQGFNDTGATLLKSTSTSTQLTVTEDESSEEEDEMMIATDSDEMSEETIALIPTATAIAAATTANAHKPLKVLFLSSDTGGGHRASAESLGKLFQQEWPGSTYELLDVWSEAGIWPYNTLVESYSKLSHQPLRWKWLYHTSNTRLFNWLYNVHSASLCERRIRQKIANTHPDIVVSVHPGMNYTPVRSVRHINNEQSKESGSNNKGSSSNTHNTAIDSNTYIPFFTVVTDYGTAHASWFDNKVDQVYLASEPLQRVALKRGKVSVKNIKNVGLPIRQSFQIQSDLLGDRTTVAGKAYQQQVRQTLNLVHHDMDADADTATATDKIVLVMGGGEGVGSLESIVQELHTELSNNNEATGAKNTTTTVTSTITIIVVCGRNEKLREKLNTRDWGNNNANNAISNNHNNSVDVKVLGLGFTSNIDEYMVASDILVTKAGPGTIAEAAALGLPLILTSFIPGQEAGNVDLVLKEQFGVYETNPSKVAAITNEWLQSLSLSLMRCHDVNDENDADSSSSSCVSYNNNNNNNSDYNYNTLSQNAHRQGRPHAARDIVRDMVQYISATTTTTTSAT
jgi:1,2-diacylglycerol 3-beta-galactosyltransferase